MKQLKVSNSRLFGLISLAVLLALVLTTAGTGIAQADPHPQGTTGINCFLNSDNKTHEPTPGSWQDVDVSADTDIPDGATGLVLEIVNESSDTDYIGQVRAKGSTDDRTPGAKIKKSTQIMAFVKLDANKVFQAYRDNDAIKFYVRGYAGSDVTFFTNWSDVAGGHTAYQTYTIDLSGNSVPGDSIAILELYDHSSNTYAGLRFRRNGDSDWQVYAGQGLQHTHQYIMIGVDSDSKFQHYKSNNDYSNFYLVGYLENRGTWKSSPSSDVAGSTTGSWADVDVTSDTSSDAALAMLTVKCGWTSSQPRKADFRKNGSSDDQYAYGAHYYDQPASSIFYVVGLDSSQIFEVKIEASAINIYVLGYTEIKPPTVTNSTGESEVTATSARLSGEVANTGGEYPTVHIYWGTTDGGTTSGNWDNDENLGTKGAETFYKDISSLTPNTTYYYRCYTFNSAGDDWADSTEEFTTLVAPPTVTTDNATSVEETSATLNGTLTEDGGEACEVRFQYGTTISYSDDTTWQSGKVTGDSFSDNITQLDKGTLYHFRAQAKNSADTDNGTDNTFLTKPDEPTNFIPTPGNGQISLSWTKGDGVNRTLIIRKEGGYPANRGDGTQVYFNSGLSHTDGGLTNGTTCYYSAWSEVTADSLQQYSDANAQASATPVSVNWDGGDIGYTPGETSFAGKITNKGVTTRAITAKSSDKRLCLIIDKGTTALNRHGRPLSWIDINKAGSPPIPEDAHIIGDMYDLQPDGTTFDPPITVTFTHDESMIPEGVAKGSLVIAYYDKAAAEWIELDSIVEHVAEANKVMAKVGHFTAFAVFGYEAVEPPPAPPTFECSSLSISPTEIYIGETVNITVLIANTGGQSGNYEVILKINGVVEADKDIALDAGASEQVTFTTSKNSAGTYSVDVGGLTISFTVKQEPVPPPPPPAEPEPAKPINWWLLSGIIAAVAVVGFLILSLARRRAY